MCNLTLRWSAALLLAVGLVRPLAGQGMSEARLQMALDKTVRFSAEDMPILGIFAGLSQETGVRFVVDQDALDYLPYGSQTRLDVSFQNVRLRDALTKLLSKQALTWEMEAAQVRILPSAPLYRMGRRPTFDELQLLSTVLNSALEPSSEAVSPIDQLRRATGVEALRIVWHVKADKESALRRAEYALPGTGRQWLNMIVRGQGWTWYLAGDAIMIIDQTQQTRRQLQTEVTVRYEDQRLVEVLRDLAARARIEVKYEPGVLNLLSETQRSNVNLRMAEATVDQALEVISGGTGLTFRPGPKGITVGASDALAEPKIHASAGPRSKRPPFYLRATLHLESGDVEVFYPADELAPEVIEKVLQKRKEILSDILADLD